VSLKPDEIDLIGSWIKDGGRVIGDSVELRIGHLISRHLQKIAVCLESGGWEVLYRDPRDGRYWELTYPHSEMHGGGPKRLANLSTIAATTKYRLNDSGA
jgi:hypothetical protein